VIAALPNKVGTWVSLEEVNAKETSIKSISNFPQILTGQMQKSFEDASYALKINELSSLVDSDSGIHIILRLA